jgi:hypothetical protein
MGRPVRLLKSVRPVVRLLLGFYVFAWVLGAIISTNFNPCPQVSPGILNVRRSVGLDCSNRGLSIHIAIIAGVLVLGFAVWHPRATTQGRRLFRSPPV